MSELTADLSKAIILKGDRTIARICDGDSFHWSTDLKSKEARAYARLFAAAPEMLEALENIENDSDQFPPHIWKMIQRAIWLAKEE